MHVTRYVLLFQIHDGGDSQARYIGRYCGNVAPPNILTMRNVVYMWFRSDHSVAHAVTNYFIIRH